MLWPRSINNFVTHRRNPTKKAQPCSKSKVISGEEKIGRCPLQREREAISKNCPAAKHRARQTPASQSVSTSQCRPRRLEGSRESSKCTIFTISTFDSWSITIPPHLLPFSGFLSSHLRHVSGSPTCIHHQPIRFLFLRFGLLAVSALKQ